MQTELLYYKDPYIKEFEAKVLMQITEGERTWVVLDKTAFYPTGGGQPFDIGTLNGIPVIEVEKTDEEIRHYIETPISDSSLIGKIDWERRFDHMQQHCGQHILSAAFEELYDIETVGFHLGSEIVTIDLKTETISWEILQQVEKRANEVVITNIPIEVKWITQEELSDYPLRKKPSVTENIRLVIIPEFDYNGCGGTHPKSTAEVGLIKIFGWEKNRGNIRLQFACGLRALKELHQKQMILNEITTQLKTSEQEAPAKLQQFLEAQTLQNKELDAVKEQLLMYEAEELASNFSQTNMYKIIASPFYDRTIKELQTLARKIVEHEERGIVLFATQLDDRLQMVLAAGKEVEIKMNDILKVALELIEGKGGGKPDFAQGGGMAKITPEEMIKHLYILLEKQIG